MKIRLQTVFLLAIFIFSVFSGAYAFKNACPFCQKMADPPDTICRSCKRPLNQCLECQTLNPASADFCSSCTADLAEMRLLASIDPETRDDLRLGQSDRAQLERSLTRLNSLIAKEPQNAEMLYYRIAKIYQKMAFFSREASAWKDFLEKFPNTKKKPRILVYRSEALRQWGYLFFQQNQKKLAQAKYLESVEANPENADSWLWLGRIYRESDDPIKSADAYMNALKARPGDPDAILYLKKMKKSIPKNLLKPIPQPEKPLAVASETFTGKAIQLQSAASGTVKPGFEVPAPETVPGATQSAEVATSTAPQAEIQVQTIQDSAKSLPDNTKSASTTSNPNIATPSNITDTAKSPQDISKQASETIKPDKDAQPSTGETTTPSGVNNKSASDTQKSTLDPTKTSNPVETTKTANEVSPSPTKPSKETTGVTTPAGHAIKGYIETTQPNAKQGNSKNQVENSSKPAPKPQSESNVPAPANSATTSESTK
ncbi:MAG: tetratricopeptide repeat protein [Candidatus Riflebacteria bacterium]|nr:tetratricopeptide repeat protein [Candidatus Riflebacteria bacterium]